MNNSHHTTPLPETLDVISAAGGLTAVENVEMDQSQFNDDDDSRNSPCPIRALDGLVVGDMAREIARVAQVPDALAIAATLGVASGAIGAGMRVRTWAGETGANLFFLAVARSGTGKDRCANLAAEPLLALEKKLIEQWESDIVPELKAEMRIVTAGLTALDKSIKDGASPETKREIQELERRRSEIEEALLAEPALTVGDITKEALVVEMARQPGEATFAFSSEARGILDVIAGRYSKTGDEDLWLAGFSGSRTKVSRMSRKTLTLEHPCLSALLFVQPDAFRRAASRPEMAESGFLPRFIPFDAKAEPRHAPDRIEALNADIADRWRGRIEELVITYRDNGNTPVVVDMEPGALHILKSYANELVDRRNDDLADLDAYAARWAEIAARIALVLHAIEFGADAVKHRVSENSATRAHMIVEWFSVEIADLLEEARETKRLERRKKLREIITEAQDGKMSLRDLDRRHKFTRKEVEALLPEIGGRIEIDRGAGRPSRVARITEG